MLADIDRLHILERVDNVLGGPLHSPDKVRERLLNEYDAIIASATRIADDDPELMIVWLAHELARARLAIHYEETRKAWLEAGR